MGNFLQALSEAYGSGISYPLFMAFFAPGYEPDPDDFDESPVFPDSGYFEDLLPLPEGIPIIPHTYGSLYGGHEHPDPDGEYSACPDDSGVLWYQGKQYSYRGKPYPGSVSPKPVEAARIPTNADLINELRQLFEELLRRLSSPSA